MSLLEKIGIKSRRAEEASLERFFDSLTRDRAMALHNKVPTLQTDLLRARHMDQQNLGMLVDGADSHFVGRQKALIPHLVEQCVRISEHESARFVKAVAASVEKTAIASIENAIKHPGRV
jgi:hypothetical protein